MKTVKELMVQDPVSCKKSESLQKVAQEMSNQNIGSLPVVDDNNKVIGMVTDRDICLSIARSDGKSVTEMKVQDVMSTDVVTCMPEDNLEAALKLMRTKQVGRIPVVNNHQSLTGILTLNRIVHETHGSKEEAQVEYKGEENVIKTLYSLALRDDREGITS